MQKNNKIILSVAAFTLFIAVAANFLIKKSDGLAPTYYVLVAKTELNIGDTITESSIEPVIVPGSLVKSQAFYWTSDGIKDSEKSEIISSQLQKVVGKKVSKLINKGAQITVIAIE